jgi:hypothetical protein
MEYFVKIILIILFILIFVKLIISKEFFDNGNLIIILNGLPKLLNNKNCNKSSDYKKYFIVNNICITQNLADSITIKNINNLSGDNQTYKVFVKRFTTDNNGNVDKLMSWYNQNTNKGIITLNNNTSKTLTFPLSGLYYFQNQDDTSIFGKVKEGINKNFQILVE